ncbi:MAG: RHS repeat-associated core domain-containing protein, partial [Thermodesulfobacteriota bacterium]
NSVMAVADDATLTELSYSPYGVTTAQNHANDLRYTGRAQVADDLYEYRARYYDPTVGRFLSEDPIGFEGSWNLYSYVGQNPVNVIDPMGLAGCYVNYPGYPITIPGTSTRVPLTHAGVLSYDDQGHTRYYEYGRYDSDFGNVRRQTVPDLTMGPDGNPTPESWARLQQRLNEIGHGTESETTCDANADADRINEFAENRMNDPNRAPYSWMPWSFNTCTTFAGDAFAAGR